jgi:hypothetical protein
VGVRHRLDPGLANQLDVSAVWDAEVNDEALEGSRQDCTDGLHALGVRDLAGDRGADLWQPPNGLGLGVSELAPAFDLLLLIAEAIGLGRSGLQFVSDPGSEAIVILGRQVAAEVVAVDAIARTSTNFASRASVSCWRVASTSRPTWVK